MEFHEPTGEGGRPTGPPPPPTFLCDRCGTVFRSVRDRRVHQFDGHPQMRPILALRGRECRRGRLVVAEPTEPDEWSIRSAHVVHVNGRQMDASSAVVLLAEQRTGVLDVALTTDTVQQEFQFQFALADRDDLDGVDAALSRLIHGRELSARAIDDFIMRSKSFPTAFRYVSGLASYLYGVAAREAHVEHEDRGTADNEVYAGRYDTAVATLTQYDRPAAEAICGLVAFHYNQFDRALAATNSQRVADVAMRFQVLLTGDVGSDADLRSSLHDSLDVALSDSVVEQVLTWSALPIDGTAMDEVYVMLSEIGSHRPYDAFKLYMVAAEQALVGGDSRSALLHADYLRHNPSAGVWYSNFRRRLEGIR